MPNSDSSVARIMRFYYSVKPFMPRGLRWMLRRRRASMIRERTHSVWPILEAAGAKPSGWRGWPDGKSFAFVLTHDVEGKEGVAKVRQLAELEIKYGFRSSFNFIPEGEYSVPADLRNWLTEKGFEIGVHDLHHNGKLYDSRERFISKAKRINTYLKEWNAGGFRSGFMLRELDWLHQLNIDYDCSTFDTDPFEPQPDGCHTIFPYWIASPNGSARDGYAELPYTLPQDSTLFILLEEPDASIWEKKADWIIERGGMVLVNVHPDYIDFSGVGGAMSFPVERYERLLAKIRNEFAAQAWAVLPREVAAFVKAEIHDGNDNVLTWPERSVGRSPGMKVWIDLENTPHIPFFKPIIDSLRERGHEVLLTARDAYQTCELADHHGLEYHAIGRHNGKHLISKVGGLLGRSLQLVRHYRASRPDLVLNLGSRSQNLAAKLLGIPVAEIMDYEHSAESKWLAPRWMLMPEAVSDELDAVPAGDRVRVYHGIKEDVYVPFFRPDASLTGKLGVDGASLLVTARPPATEAHYHNSESETLFAAFIRRLLEVEGSRVILLPRNHRQHVELRANHPEWFGGDRVMVPDGVIDGLNLIWHSDLVVSGGGTMNREAAALGVPVYSVFKGSIGAVDRRLAKEGRLTLIASEHEILEKMRFVAPRQKMSKPSSEPRQAFSDILSHLECILTSLGTKCKMRIQV